MSDRLDPDHWCNGGEYMWYPHPDALAMEALEALEAENKQLRAEVEQLRQALHDARIENSGQAAELERIRAKRRWIPISERLPEVGKDVFACHSLHRCVWIQAFNKSGVWIGYEPTHWMPLPPLPEKVQV